LSHFDLTGKVALVTGGNGGIGLGMARGLGEAGAAVLVVGRNGEKNDAAVAALAAAGVDAAASITDVTDEGAVAEMIETAIARWGRLDILVNNAGINIRKEPQDLALAEWRTVLDTNLTSAFICCQAVYPHMVAQGGGKIINIGSMMSIFGAAFTPAYASSKGGIVQLTKATATAWAKHNIQVNAVLPGWIDTDLTRRGRREIEGLHEKVLARTPAARWGEAADMAGIAVFLSAPASDFVTGTAIPVDGGFSVQG
jgi:2-dehydro-3-deoxy-D-gluconate 5-dehydrogenase